MQGSVQDIYHHLSNLQNEIVEMPFPSPHKKRINDQRPIQSDATRLISFVSSILALVDSTRICSYFYAHAAVFLHFS